VNDDFLSEFRKAPREEFARNLYAQLSQGQRMPDARRQNLYPKRFALALAALLLAFVLAMAVSPTARAAVMSFIQKIITSQGVTIIVEDSQPAQSGEGESYARIWTPANAVDLPKDYPSLAKLPAWVPPGYIMQGRAALVYWSMYEENPSALLVEWKNDMDGVIQLSISEGACPNGPTDEAGNPRSDCVSRIYFSVGKENEPEIVKLQGRSVFLFPRLLLLADLSDPIQKWNPEKGVYDNRDPQALFLVWESHGQTFEMAVKAPDLPREDLLRMVESIP
jgi:hypothetical protein